MMAGIIVSLGALPVLLMASPLGPHGVAHQLLAVLTGGGALLIGALWGRGCWPTRAQSQLCILGGSVCATVVCLIMASPATGLLGASTFAALAAAGVVFHSPRVAALTWALAAVTLAVLATRLIPNDGGGVSAFAGVVLVALIVVFVTFAAGLALRVLDADTGGADIEPVTGLLSRAGFAAQVATMIGARSRDDDRYLVVMTVDVDSFSLLTAMAGRAGGIRARVAVGQQLRDTVRGGAILAHVGDSEFLVADVFTHPDPAVLAERVRSAISTGPLRLTASIGVVATALRPLAQVPPDDVLDELLNHATLARCEARHDGGNQIRQRRVTAPTPREDPDDDDIWTVDRSA